MAYDPKKVINIALKEVGYLEKKKQGENTLKQMS